MEFLLAEGKEGFGFVTLLKTCFCDRGLAVGYYDDAFLMLMDIVALILQA